MIDIAGVRRLNYGCGFDKREGYLNVDSDPGCAPDLLIVDNDLSVLPTNWFEEIVAMDVLEHIPRVETLAVLLKWSELLADGGRLRIETSSIEGVANQIAKNASFGSHYGWTHCLFGTQAQEGDFHLTGFTDTTLKVHLLAAGYAVEKMWVTGLWLLNAEATKVASWTKPLERWADLPDDEFVRSAYREVLHRDADTSGLDYLLGELSAGRWSRRDALFHLMSSPERLFVTAEHNGFEQLPKASLSQRVLPHIPHALRPPLRSLSRTARTATERGRRALGALNGHKPVS